MMRWAKTKGNTQPNNTIITYNNRTEAVRMLLVGKSIEAIRKKRHDERRGLETG
jgi:hypothetical protein